MKDKMHSAEQIIKKLREADEMLAGIPPSISSMIVVRGCAAFT